MESVIPCEPNGSGDSLLLSTDLLQAVAYRDFCYSLKVRFRRTFSDMYLTRCISSLSTSLGR